MADRAALHALIDQLPDDKLDNVHMMLDHVLHPPPPTPEMEWLQQRNEELRTRFQEHVEQIRAGKKSGFIMGSAGGSISRSVAPEKGHAECSHSWWEDRVHVRHHVILHAGHEVHLTERMHMTEDGKKLVYAKEIFAAGRTVKHEDEFEMSDRAS